eukprot:670245-Rhodomonas_salina.1
MPPSSEFVGIPTNSYEFLKIGHGSSSTRVHLARFPSRTHCQWTLPDSYVLRHSYETSPSHPKFCPTISQAHPLRWI